MNSLLEDYKTFQLGHCATVPVLHDSTHFVGLSVTYKGERKQKNREHSFYKKKGKWTKVGIPTPFLDRSGGITGGDEVWILPPPTVSEKGVGIPTFVHFPKIQSKARRGG